MTREKKTKGKNDVSNDEAKENLCLYMCLCLWIIILYFAYLRVRYFFPFWFVVFFKKILILIWKIFRLRKKNYRPPYYIATHALGISWGHTLLYDESGCWWWWLLLRNRYTGSFFCHTVSRQKTFISNLFFVVLPFFLFCKFSMIK